MRIAVIGAGLAGLSCAHELERHGMKAVVYERNAYIGDQITHVSALLEIMDRPIRDIIRYIRQEYALDLKPYNKVNRITHFSPRKTTAIKGNLGYFMKRGNDAQSIINQIHAHLKHTEIKLNQAPEPEALAAENDYVIIANGNQIYPDIWGCWQNWLNSYVKGAIVLGEFNPQELIVWLNKSYCNRTYAYLTPFDRHRASLQLITSDVNEKEVEHYWELFWGTENLNYDVLEEFTLEHRSGWVYPLVLGKYIFAGNAGGALDPFLGFGQYNSITMGVMAARSIVYQQDYAQLVEKVLQKNKNLLQFRKVYDRLGNSEYDFLVSLIGLPGIKHLTYNTPINIVKYGALTTRLLPLKKK